MVCIHNTISLYNNVHSDCEYTEEPSTKSDLKKANTKMKYVELKEEIISTNNYEIIEKSETIFIAEIRHLKENAFEFIDTYFDNKLKLTGNKKQGWSDVQYFLTVPGMRNRYKITQM